MSRLNRFSFQDENKQPQKDFKNRVIVTFLYGADQIHEVNSEEASEVAVRELLETPDEKNSSKSVRLRLSRDISSVYPHEIMAETTQGNYVGFIRNNSWLSELFYQVSEDIRGFVSDHSGFVFDFWAEVQGVYFDENFLDEYGREYFHHELTSKIRFKYPIEIDILSNT
jgi:hypothetical protein